MKGDKEGKNHTHAGRRKKGIYVKAIIMAQKNRAKAPKIRFPRLMENHLTPETVDLCNELLHNATYPCSVLEILVPCVAQGFGSCLGETLTHYTSIMSAGSRLFGRAACVVPR